MKLITVVVVALFGSTSCLAQQNTDKTQRAGVTADGLAHIGTGAIPLSSYMSEEARQAFVARYAADPESSPAIDWDSASDEQRREYLDSAYRPLVDRARTVYPVTIIRSQIANVMVDILEPVQGVAIRNRQRVLINLHGGSYGFASRGLPRLLEAIPIAGFGKIKVVSVDYRTSPENKYPAATEDAIAVYRQLLKAYKPQNIGIYGNSTGAALTAVVTAWLQKEKLPRPGAVGLFFEGAIKDDLIEGDSYYVSEALTTGTIPRAPFPMNPYMADADAQDPLVAPVVSLEVLAKFPPTLLLSGTRDIGLSGILYTHSRLAASGAEADLYVWDGMWHTFLSDVTLPESRRAYEVVIRFFDKHMGH
jgi:monoterpene epsilon-lactone hydrolase